MWEQPRSARARSDCQRRSTYAAPAGPARHSWFSSAFTRAKGAIETGLQFIPIVGGAASHLVDGIHTGDEHQDANGIWVNNADGSAIVPANSGAAQAQIDAINKFNSDELQRVRSAAADSAARLGAAATANIASAIDPSFLKRNATTVALAAAVVVVLIVILAKRGR